MTLSWTSFGWLYSNRAGYLCEVAREGVENAKADKEKDQSRHYSCAYLWIVSLWIWEIIVDKGLRRYVFSSCAFRTLMGQEATINRIYKAILGPRRVSASKHNEAVLGDNSELEVICSNLPCGSLEPFTK